MSINNEIIRVTNKNHNFEKGLAFIANNVFLYYNSIKMINDTDPNKYPKKSYDQLIVQQRGGFDESNSRNNSFQQILAFFNAEFKKTVALHKDIWVSVNNNFNVVDGKLYEAVKNCLENLQKIPKYNRKNLLEFIKGFVEIPDYLKEETITSDYKIDLYYPSYTGNIEHNEYEKWIIIKLGFIKQKIGKHSADEAKIPHYAQHTQVSIRGKETILKENDVMRYYNLTSEPPELVELLFTHCLYQGYAAEMPDTRRNFVKKFREKLVVQNTKDTKDERSMWVWMNKEFSKLYYEKMKGVMARFIGKVKGILEKRAQKVEAAKNIVKSFVHKFKIDHEKIDRQTENNMLLMFKDSVGRRLDLGRSRFSNEYEINMREFQTRHELIDLQSRQCNRLQPISLQRQATEEWQYLQPEERFLNDVHRNEYLHWRAIDRFKLNSDLKYHYLNNQNKEQTPRNQLQKDQTPKGSTQKQLGPEVNIEESVGEINKKILYYLINQRERMMAVHSNISIEGKVLTVTFSFSPSSIMNANHTKIVLNLELPLVDYKEQLLKSNDIKFQSCYPIIYHFLAIEQLRKAFIPSKVESLSRRAGVREIIVTSILNSMGRKIVTSLHVSDYFDRASLLSAVCERQLQADSLHQV